MTIGWQIFALILLAGATGAWGMHQWLLYTGAIQKHSEKIRNEIWKHEDYLAQKDRARHIRKIVDERMNSVPSNLRTMDRKILVRYETLLKIWDIASKIEDHA